MCVPLGSHIMTITDGAYIQEKNDNCWSTTASKGATGLLKAIMKIHNEGVKCKQCTLSELAQPYTQFRQEKCLKTSEETLSTLSPVRVT